LVSYSEDAERAYKHSPADFSADTIEANPNLNRIDNPYFGHNASNH
jgi:hypothetical protein